MQNLPNQHTRPSLLILGAGPKAVAVQAKAHALHRLGLPAPEITVVDHQGVGGNWRSGGGWTDGRHQLGTSPTKDVGFPYRTRIAGEPEVNQQVDRELLHVSWSSFMVDTGRYAWWVDHGQPNPRHYLWADYLRWAAGRSRMRTVNGQVTRIGIRDQRWSLTVDGADSRLSADALMITGPGRSDRRIAPLPTVFSVSGFFNAVSSATLPPASRVAVIGGGETSASIVEQLIGHDVVEISVLSPAPTIFTRAEGSFENELYTDPRLWSGLDEPSRRDVINRCDRGVFSAQVQGKLMGEDRVSHLRGRVHAVHDRDGLAEVHVGDSVELFDMVVDARGNSPLWFTRMMNDQVVAQLIGACGGAVTPGSVERRINADLSMAGMHPTLLLPTLAGFRQGPGLANLSCLGELSDRVLAGLGAGAAPDPDSLRHTPSRSERTLL